MKITPINIPKNDDQFEVVPFVHQMTNFQLKVCIKRLWNNIQLLANQLDGRRKDVSIVLDKILEGKRWKPNELDDRYIYFSFYENIIKYDTLNKSIDILDKKFNSIIEDIKGVTLSDLKKYKKGT